MAHQTTDLRILRTKKNIHQAMISLLTEKSFDKITINDISKKADISRGTFYLHYQDKYELVEKYQEELLEKAQLLFEITSHENRQEFFVVMLRFFSTEGELLSLLLSNNGTSEIQIQVKQLLKQNAQVNILPHLSIKISDKTEERYLLAYLSNAMFGLLQEWLDSEKKESPEELARIADRIVPFQLV